MDESEYIIQPTIRTVRLRTAILAVLCALAVGFALGWDAYSHQPVTDEWCHRGWRECLDARHRDISKTYDAISAQQTCESELRSTSRLLGVAEGKMEECHERAGTHRR